MEPDKPDQPMLLTPTEWRVLLRHAESAQMATKTVASLLGDPDVRPEVGEATRAVLSARMRAHPGPGR